MILLTFSLFPSHFAYCVRAVQKLVKMSGGKLLVKNFVSCDLLLYM